MGLEGLRKNPQALRELRTKGLDDAPAGADPSGGPPAD
jgi:hypothetical protein